MSSDPRAVEALATIVRSGSSDLQVIAGRAVGWNVAKESIERDLKSKDQAVVQNAIDTVLRIGATEAIPDLLDVLNRWSKEELGTWIAETYLNSGQMRLEAAARAWAAREGLIISSQPDYSGRAKWGS